MFEKKLHKLAAFIAAVAAAITVVGCAPSSDDRRQDIAYTESVENIDNPDQGFYRPIFVKVTETGVNYNKNIVGSARLYHLRIDISAFSSAVNNEADKPLSAAALDGLDGLLAFLKSRDKNAVVRFAYDPYFGGKANLEPSPQTIDAHIKQICPVLNKYVSTITAIETGLIGPWGEMHTSKIAKAEYITPIVDAFLSETSAIPVSVRTPKMIYDYLGITVNDIDGYVIGEGDKAYRLGLYNDGYLGSNTDLGTYTNREKEIEFLSRQTDHLPYGGEVVIPGSALHNIDACLPEMFKMHLNYLNIEWNNQVIDKWKNSYYTASCGGDELYYGQTAFDYISKHMGYRYVVTDSVFECSDGGGRLDVRLSLKNVGFGNLNKHKHAELVFTDADGETVETYQAPDFTGGDSYSCSIAPDLPSGDYGVYLRLYGDKSDDGYLYCMQFANSDMYSAALRANKIGAVSIGK